MSVRATDGGSHGGVRRGVAWALDEIDPTTLPDDPRAAWDEARRRYQAYQAGRDGWRTGRLSAELDEYPTEEEL